MNNDTSMKRMLALFESSGSETEDDVIRIVVPETKSNYYAFGGTREEAEAFCAKVNAGEIDLSESDLVEWVGESDHTDIGTVWVA